MLFVWFSVLAHLIEFLLFILHGDRVDARPLLGLCLIAGHQTRSPRPLRGLSHAIECTLILMQVVDVLPVVAAADLVRIRPNLVVIRLAVRKFIRFP